MKNKSWFEGQVVEQNLDGKTVEFCHSECELMEGVLISLLSFTLCKPLISNDKIMCPFPLKQHLNNIC